MALAVTALTSGNDTDSGSSATTASISPTGDALIICDVINIRADVGSPPTTPTVTGNGLTWVQVATVTFFDFGGGDTTRMTRFRAMGASPSSGAVTIDCGGVNQNRILYSVYELTGVDTGGANGADAVVQSVTNKLTSAGTTLTVTLAAFGSANNYAIGGFGGLGTSGDWTVGSGFTQIHELFGIFTEYKANDTTVDVTTDTSQVFAGIASEIKEATTRRYSLSLSGVG